jgi:class 3 adenylate cyclase
MEPILLTSPDTALRHDGRGGLTTVLCTDIVGSTATAWRLGDRRWRDVLHSHYAACLAGVEESEGEVVDTTGDGILALFEGPARAVRAAFAIQAAARAACLTVRAGVHAGTCERFGRGVAGFTIHVAARICALAGADEVLATAAVRDLAAAGGPLAFEPRGHSQLRGVPGSLAVFRAVQLA